MSKKIKKIGIFGGTFDPVHMGHIGLATDSAEQTDLDEIVFMPAKLQPFKLHKNVTEGEDRLAMLKLALEPFHGFSVSSYELDSAGVSYTYLTMRAMRRIYGECSKLYFITGTDTFLKIEFWKEAKELLTNYSFIIGARPGYKKVELKTCIERIGRVYNTEIRIIDNVEMDISSTDIRKGLESGNLTGNMIPKEVERYIRNNGLYR